MSNNIADLTREAQASAREHTPAPARESAFAPIEGTECESTDKRGTVAIARKRSTGVLSAVFTPASGKRAQALPLAYVADLGYVHADADDETLAAAGLQRVPAPKPKTPAKTGK